MNHRTIRRQAWVVLGALSLVSACTGGGPADSKKSEDPTGSATQVGARAALTGFDCRADDKGSWSAKGTLNNPDSAKATYVVRISVAGKDSHVVASTTKNVTVEAAGKSPLDVADFGKANGKGLDCSAHVTRAVS
jgi:hypothetical protein